MAATIYATGNKFGTLAGQSPEVATKLAQREPTVFDGLFSSVHGVKDVQSRLESLAAKFFGPSPETDSAGAPYSMGLIGDVSRATDDINHAVNRMHDILNSIERAIP